MEDVGIDDVNIASVSLNSSKRDISYEINWISFVFLEWHPFIKKLMLYVCIPCRIMRITVKFKFVMTKL